MAVETLLRSGFVAERSPAATPPPRTAKTLEVFAAGNNRASRQDLHAVLCPGQPESPKTTQVLASAVSATRNFLKSNGQSIIFLEEGELYIIEDDIKLPNGQSLSITGVTQREAARLFISNPEGITFNDLYPDETDPKKGNRNLKAVVGKIRKPFEKADYSIVGETEDDVTHYRLVNGAPKKEAKLKNGKRIESHSPLQNRITEFLSAVEEPVPTDALIELFFDPNDMTSSRRKLRAVMRDIQKRAVQACATVTVTPQAERGHNLYQYIHPKQGTVESWNDGIESFREFAMKNFQVLSPQQLEIIEARAGLINGTIRSQEEVARSLGIPLQTVVQIEKGAMLSLKRASLNGRLQAFLGSAAR